MERANIVFFGRACFGIVFPILIYSYTLMLWGRNLIIKFLLEAIMIFYIIVYSSYLIKRYKKLKNKAKGNCVPI